MNANSDWADIGEEEEALLRRCRKFVIGSPHSPGGGPKDIIYYTPCDRWLRVCSQAAYHQRSDVGDEEIAFRIDSGMVRKLLS